MVITDHQKIDNQLMCNIKFGKSLTICPQRMERSGMKQSQDFGIAALRSQ